MWPLQLPRAADASLGSWSRRNSGRRLSPSSVGIRLRSLVAIAAPTSARPSLTWAARSPRRRGQGHRHRPAARSAGPIEALRKCHPLLPAKRVRWWLPDGKRQFAEPQARQQGGPAKVARDVPIVPRRAHCLSSPHGTPGFAAPWPPPRRHAHLHLSAVRITQPHHHLASPHHTANCALASRPTFGFQWGRPASSTRPTTRGPPPAAPPSPRATRSRACLCTASTSLLLYRRPSLLPRPPSRRLQRGSLHQT